MWWTNLSTKRLYFAMLKVKQWSSKFSKQSEFGLESASCKTPIFLSKPNWNWFGKSYAFFGCYFSKPNWIWFGKGHWMKCSCSVIGQNFDNNICTSCAPYFASSAVVCCTCYNYLDPGKLPQWCSRSPLPPLPVLGQFGGHLRLLDESSLSFDNIYPVGISSTIFLGGSTRCILRPVALLNGRVVIETSRAAHCVSLSTTH